MTCKDCLFCDVCYLVEHYGVDLTENGVEYDCEQFLNKNQYAKVVRCKDCKHFGGHGVCYCHAADENGTPIFVRENDFCSYGERKDNGIRKES